MLRSRTPGDCSRRARRWPRNRPVRFCGRCRASHARASSSAQRIASPVSCRRRSRCSNPWRGNSRGRRPYSWSLERRSGRPDAAPRRSRCCAAPLRRYPEALRLLERCLELAPGFDAARHNYASLLNRSGRAEAALKQVEQLLAKAPRDPGYRNLQAAILANLGDYSETIRVYEGLLEEQPAQAKMWMSYGHALRTTGRVAESVAAYRRAIVLAPTLGEAYWSLANLKTFHFTEEDARAMHATLGHGDLGDEDRLHFEFALGKMREDQAAYEESFAHYARGNALR